MRNGAVRLVPFLLLLLFVSCGKAKQDARPVVTVSIEPLRYFAESIAGGQFRVATLVPVGASPEVYQPTPQQMIDLSESKLYFKVGTLGFEQTKLDEMTKAAPETRTVDTSRGIALLQDCGCCGHGGHDQHTWLSVKNARVILRNMCAAFCEIDTANTGHYESRLAEQLHRLDSLDAALRTVLVDAAQRDFLIFHPALGYFSADYGFRQKAIQHEGKEPSPRQMAELIRWAKAQSVKTVFVQKEHSARAAQRIADEIGAEVVTINPLSYDWTAEMLNIAHHLSHHGNAD